MENDKARESVVLTVLSLILLLQYIADLDCLIQLVRSAIVMEERGGENSVKPNSILWQD